MFHYDINELEEKWELVVYELWLIWMSVLFYLHRVAVLPRVLMRLGYWVVFFFFLKTITVFKIFAFLFIYLSLYRFILHPRGFACEKRESVEYFAQLPTFLVCIFIYLFCFNFILVILLNYSPLFSIWCALNPTLLKLSFLSFVPLFPLLWFLKLFILNPFVYIIYYMYVGMSMRVFRLFYAKSSHVVNLFFFSIYYIFFFCFWGFILSELSRLPLYCLALYLIWWHTQFLDDIVDSIRGLGSECADDSMAFLRDPSFIPQWEVDFNPLDEEAEEKEKVEQQQREKEAETLRKRKLGELEMPAQPTVKNMLEYQQELYNLKRELLEKKQNRGKKQYLMYQNALDAYKLRWEQKYNFLTQDSVLLETIYTPVDSILPTVSSLSITWKLVLKQKCWEYYSKFKLFFFKKITPLYTLYYTLYYKVCPLYKQSCLVSLKFLAIYHYYLFWIIVWPKCLYLMCLRIDFLIFELLEFCWLGYIRGFQHVPVDVWDNIYRVSFLNKTKMSFTSFTFLFLSFIFLNILFIFSFSVIYCTFSSWYYGWLFLKIRFLFIGKALYEMFILEFLDEFIYPFTWFLFFSLDTSLCSYLGHFLEW